MNATERHFPAFLNRRLDNPPHAGQGVHQWLYTTARQLHAHMTPGEIVNLLAARVADCGRIVKEREIRTAVVNAEKTAWKPR